MDVKFIWVFLFDVNMSLLTLSTPKTHTSPLPSVSAGKKEAAQQTSQQRVSGTHIRRKIKWVVHCVALSILYV